MSSLVKLFANPTLVEVLNLFLLNPEEEFYQYDIVKKTHRALMQVQRALKRLAETGIITFSRRGKMIYYKALRRHPAFEDLKKLFLKTVAMGEHFRTALEPSQNKVQLAFIFGSVAEGAESIDSDIDLCIIADLGLREISKVLSPLSKQLGREINPVIFAPHEFQKRIAKKDHFLLNVLRSSKIWILGDENTFKEPKKGHRKVGQK